VAQPTAAALAALEQRVAALEEKLQHTTILGIGRKPVIEDCKHGFAEGECPKASLYQYQKGCHGQQCWEINAKYYAGKRKDAKKADEPPAKPEPKKRVRRTKKEA
jgi:hypothetical protein